MNRQIEKARERISEISRREFLKYGIGAGIGALVGGSIGYLGTKNHNEANAQEKLILINPENKKKNETKYTLDDYIDSVIKIESNGNAKAERYEAHLNDTSYGLGQLLTRTAKDLERRHSNLPRLGEKAEDIKNNLCNPDINKAYTRTLFKEELDFYNDSYLAVAAYNAGHLTPRNARCQEQLNNLYNSQLVTDGIFGEESKKILMRFQREYGLGIDGKLGEKTYAKLQEVWQLKNSKKANPSGIIPINNYTPNHVEKFKKALEKIKK